MNPIDTLDLRDDSGTTSTTPSPDAVATTSGGRDTTTPPPQPPERTDGRRWPRRARVTVALAIVVAGLGVAGAVVGLAREGDSDELESLRQEVVELRTERADAIDAADELEQRLAVLEARLGAAVAERDRAAEELAAREGDNAALTARIAELDTEIAGTRAELAGVVSARDAALSDIEQLEFDLATARTQAARAIAERDSLAARFPITPDRTVDVADVVGSYRTTWHEQFCSGLPTCGTAPKAGTATVRTTSAGFLRIELGSVVTTDLGRVPGGLHAVAGSTTAVPACDGAARAATVTTTVLPDSWTVAEDRSVVVRSWGGAVTIDAPATGSCPAVLASYGVSLAPVG